MSTNERRQATTILVGCFAALSSVFIGLLASDVPKILQPFVSSPTAWAIGLTCTFPLIIILVTNQISLLLKTSADREDIVHDVVRLLPQSSLIIHFETSAEAMDYLIRNVARAKRIFNTRLATGEVEASDPLNLAVTQRFDDAVWAAVKSGADYNLIVSSDHEPLAMRILADRNKYVTGGTRDIGNCNTWILDNSNVPLFHFAILEYVDGSELLLGWALTSSRNFGDRVFLIRDERVVQYFRSIFEMFVSASRRTTTT